MKKTCSSILVVILISMMARTAAFAEPSSGVTWLMTEPYTLFDKGMDELNRTMQNIECRQDKCYRGVRFDFDKNRIRIIVWDDIRDIENKSGKVDELKDTLRESAQKMVETIKDKLRTKSTTGRPRYLFVYAFEHKGYTKSDAPAKLGEKLSTIIEIESSMKHSEKGIFATCKSSLNDKDIYCK